MPKYQKGQVLYNNNIPYKILRITDIEFPKYVLFVKMENNNNLKVGEKEFYMSCNYIDNNKFWLLHTQIYTPTTLADKMF